MRHAKLFKVKIVKYAAKNGFIFYATGTK